MRLVVAVIFGAASAANSAPGSWSGSLDARVGPGSPSAIPLVCGQREFVSVKVSGQIKLGEAPWSGSAGSDYYGFASDERPPHGYTHGIVVARINGSHFPIEGGSRSFDSPHSGQVFLYVNDDASTDNQGGFDVTVTIAPALAGDADEDGLNDALEDRLLDQFAPHIQFDASEGVRPSDVYWFLRNSYLTPVRDEGSGNILDCRQVPYYAEWFLDQLSVPFGEPINPPRTRTNYLAYDALVAACINPRNQEGNRFRNGPDWERVDEACSMGVYGHVVPQDPETILLQYNLFYGYNNIAAPFGIADHEGDWELFEVYVDRNEPYEPSSIRKVIWRGHSGNGSVNALAVWDRECQCWFWTESGDFNERLGKLPDMPPKDGHAPVFVEAGSHGGWPCPVDYFGVGSNWGNSPHSYVPNEIPNLGEVYRPRLGQEVVLQFNGRWGAFAGARQDTPPSPPIQGGNQPWVWPSTGNDIAQYVGQWNHGQSHPNGTGPSGLVSWPHPNLSGAVKASSKGQTILVYPGNYAEALTISQPVKLKAPHGGVTIGR